jgi:hypothetical protein
MLTAFKPNKHMFTASNIDCLMMLIDSGSNVAHRLLEAKKILGMKPTDTLTPEDALIKLEVEQRRQLTLMYGFSLN